MNNKCEGCILLENGQGGENQLAHMFPGGCLYEDEDNLSEQAEIKLKQEKMDILAKENIEFLNKITCKICIICKHTLVDTLNKFVCEDCEKQEEKTRHIRHQAFNFNKYENI